MDDGGKARGWIVPQSAGALRSLLATFRHPFCPRGLYIAWVTVRVEAPGIWGSRRSLDALGWCLHQITFIFDGSTLILMLRRLWKFT